MQALAPGGSTKLDAAALEAILEEAPSVTKSQPEVVGTPLADLLASLGMQPSKSAARRLIKVCSPVDVRMLCIPRACSCAAWQSDVVPRVEVLRPMPPLVLA